MAKEHILVVEDEEDILELISYNLIKNGYQVSAASMGDDAIESVIERQPHLILLDIMLPDIDGLEICRRLKSDDEFKNVPIIMVSAKGEETDICRGLELGADDYIVKPFSVKVLLARVESVLRRAKQEIPKNDDQLEMYGISLNPDMHEVKIDGNPIDLTLTEFRILQTLIRKPGWVFTRYQIVNAVHGSNHVVTDRSVDFQIVGLRKKLLHLGDSIETVRGVGYRFKESHE